jgi:hypothetical protein
MRAGQNARTVYSMNYAQVRPERVAEILRLLYHLPPLVGRCFTVVPLYIKGGAGFASPTVFGPA